MKKRTYRTLAVLFSIAMLAGSVAVPVSAETSASEIGFPEGLTYQQVCAMSEEKFLDLPYAEDLVKSIYKVNTTFCSYYLELNRPAYDLEYGHNNYANGVIVAENNVYHLSEDYIDAFTAYYGEEIAENALKNIMSTDRAGLVVIGYKDGVNYTHSVSNIGVYGENDLIQTFYFPNTQNYNKLQDPVKKIEKAYNWTETYPIIRYIYDYNTLWENSIEMARQNYGYFYIFGEKVHMMSYDQPLGMQPYEPICGDANADGMVTITDVIYLQKSIAGLLLRSNTTDTNGDLYYDGVMDERDVEILLRYLVGLEETLPVVPET